MLRSRRVDTDAEAELTLDTDCAPLCGCEGACTDALAIRIIAALDIALGPTDEDGVELCDSVSVPGDIDCSGETCARIF